MHTRVGSAEQRTSCDGGNHQFQRPSELTRHWTKIDAGAWREILSFGRPSGLKLMVERTLRFC